MHQLNNLDVIILIIVLISALIALSRGFVKEVLSITGWVIASALVIALLPILNPITLNYIESGTVAGITTAMIIIIVFMVAWILLTGKLVDKIKTSKLKGMDRALGLFFGILRAFLLVILFHILVGWIIPPENQSRVLTDSKYFKIAGAFAKPIESLIPQTTLDTIREKAIEIQSPDQIREKKKDESDELFEKLAQPRVKAKTDNKKEIKEEVGYDKKERQDMERLIDTVH